LGELVGTETFKGFESVGVVVGVDEVGQLLSQWLEGVVVEAFYSGFFYSTVYALDLGRSHLDESVFDAVLLANLAEERWSEA